MTMQASDRAQVISGLRALVVKTAAHLRAQVTAEGSARERARKLYEEERAWEPFAAWTDLLARRAALLWVLKSVFVRMLEDHGWLARRRLLDPESQELFAELAPNLAETAFLRWVYRDLASPAGGLPELFAPRPVEVVAEPSNILSRELLDFWRQEDPETGRRWSFAGERFDGEFLGDLYQELDPLVKDRFAFGQTPDFVCKFILEQTLLPAIEEFGAARVRLLDPACGSGNFLVDGLKWLVAATQVARPEWDRRRVVMDCLDRVVGVDLNDYACALARTRLLMTAADLLGVTSLKEAAELRSHVYWVDGLEQVEETLGAQQQQLDLFDAGRQHAVPRNWTRAEARTAWGQVLSPKFHAVVANPPCLLERDKARKEYHRAKVGRRIRYISAFGKYSLAALFTERCFQLAREKAYVGLVTRNHFTKRAFGRPLIQDVLPELDLTLVVDAAQAGIPFHDSSTVLLFGRNRPPEAGQVRVVMGKEREIRTPVDPAAGKVWASIVEGWGVPGYDNEYISTHDVEREILARHPWSLDGGPAPKIKSQMERAGEEKLDSFVSHHHLTLDRGGGVFNRTVPKIELARGAIEGDPLALLGALNSSSACFWMKQVFHRQGQSHKFEASKLRQFPLPRDYVKVVPYVREMDACASRRAERSLAGVLGIEGWTHARALRAVLQARREADLADLFRMVGLQEELDWLCYRLYGIDQEVEVLPLVDVEPIPPTWLPWVLELAEQGSAATWFEDHRWSPPIELADEVSDRVRDLVAGRRARIQDTASLRLIESSAHKRQWYCPDYESEEHEALSLWLGSEIESALSQRKAPATAHQVANLLQFEPRVLAVAEVLTGRRDFNLEELVGEWLQAGAVPNHRFHVYKSTGLAKRGGNKITSATAPRFTRKDFVKGDYYRFRGEFDVPREHFIAFTEVPDRPASNTLYGWAGWTPLERLRALLIVDEDLEDAGVVIEDRLGVLDSAWCLLPRVAGEDAKAARRLRAEMKPLVGARGPSVEQLENWRQRFPPRRFRGSGRRNKG